MQRITNCNSWRRQSGTYKVHSLLVCHALPDLVARNCANLAQKKKKKKKKDAKLLLKLVFNPNFTVTIDVAASH